MSLSNQRRGAQLEKTKEEREQVKKALRDAGTSMYRIAKELGVTQTTVGMVVRGHVKSRRIEDHIAAILKKRPEEIWAYRGDSELP